MAAQKNTKNIVRYKKRKHIHVSTILFLLILLYIIIIFFVYWKKERIEIFEVEAGHIASNSSYTGLILREEQVVAAENSGYINYYLREGQKASVGTTVFSIDETGSFTEQLQSAIGSASGFSDEQLEHLKERLYLFSAGFKEQDFASVYDLRYKLELEIVEDVYASVLESLNETMDKDSFVQKKTDISGVVVYHLDQYEGLTENQLTKELFQRKKYEAVAKKAGELVEAGTSVYKILPNDQWNLYFLISEEDAAKYHESERLKITLSETEWELSAPFSLVYGSDGTAYGKLAFPKYGVEFAEERFLDFEIQDEGIAGLKIPKSAVAEQEFYIIPKDYAAYGGDSNSLGFNVQAVGTEETSFVIPVFYGADETNYYVGMKDFRIGDTIFKPESAETYVVNSTGKLVGVYNINQGYAYFRRVNILAEVGDLYIVEKGFSYSIAKYDHIVLKSNKVEEYQVIY